jgi:RecA-family ATPase
MRDHLNGGGPLSIVENNQRDKIAILKDRKFILYRDLDLTSTKIWLVKNLLGAGEASAGYGAPSSGKSALFEDMGLHIAGGLPWHGRDVLQGAVIFVAFERANVVIRRAIAFRKKHGIEDLPFAVVRGIFDFRDQERTAAAIAEIVRQVEEETGHKVVLIIFDTISRALMSFGGDENSSRDMGAVVSTTGRIQKKTGAHVQWIHHIPVDGGERLRGHGALLGSLDTTINVEKHASGLRTATVIKANDSEEGEKIAFTLESVEIGPETTAPVVVPAEDQPLAKSKEPRLTKNQETMFSILQDAGQPGLSTEEWNERTKAVGLGIKRPADLYDVRASLKSKNLARLFNDRWNAAN